MMTTTTSLIPGLPDDIALECLVRVPHRWLPGLRLVCRSWKREVESPRVVESGALALILELLRLPRTTHYDKPLLEVMESRKNTSGTIYPDYPITLRDPQTGECSPVPKIPELTRGLPRFCRVVFIGDLYIVVLGGFDAPTMTISNAVYVYDRNAVAWRRASPLPGPRRFFFDCATREDTKTVAVGGGRSEEDNRVLPPSYLYTLPTDSWEPLSDDFIRMVLGDRY